MGRPKSYSKQDGCHNCGFCYVERNCDAGPDYFCMCDGEMRPSIGDEIIDIMEEAAESHGWSRDEARKRWRGSFQTAIEWESAHEVDPWGTCEHWYVEVK